MRNQVKDEFGWVEIQLWASLKQKGNLDIDKCHVAGEAEISVMNPQAKEQQGLLATT
jgi:hypothetical protein